MLKATSYKHCCRSLFSIIPNSDIYKMWFPVFSKKYLFPVFVNLQQCKAKVNNINVQTMSINVYLKASAIYY